MDFQIKAGKDVVNQWVDVTVKGGAGQLISNVTTALDGFPIGNDNLNPPEGSYQRTWSQVGSGVPGATHKVEVTAIDHNEKQEAASKTWQDQGGSVSGP